MKTYQDIDYFRVKAITIDDHYVSITVNGDKEAVAWCSVDGISFDVPGYSYSISIDSEMHSTDVEIEHGRIVFDSYKPGVDVEHFLWSFEDDESHALEIDFEEFQTFDLIEAHIVADYGGTEDIGPHHLMITALEIHFVGGEYVEVTDEQLINLHLHNQRSNITQQLQLQQLRLATKEDAL